MGTIKGRNGKDLTEAEEIKKKWQEDTEELYRKGYNDPDDHDGVVTHLERDSLDCEVKWASGSTAINKASGCGGIPVELFKTSQDDASRVLHSICHQIWKTLQWPQDWKIQSSSQVPRRVVLKKVQTIRQLYSSPMQVRSYFKSYMLGFSIM